MIELKPDECRVLGVLIEKAQTTPQQYPLTLNSLTLGCNQKNNRLPVVNWDEERVFDGVDGLRAKGLVREASLSGSRVTKYRHIARETLSVDTAQLVILAELLLRGPQSLGDVRLHASRMHPFESMEATQAVLESLMGLPEPMVRESPPPPGSRARLFAQLLCPGLHPLNASAGDHGGGGGSGRAEGDGHPPDGPGLAARIDALEAQIGRLREAVRTLASAAGRPDPLA